MTQPSNSNIDRNYKREILLRATAQLAWDLVSSLPLRLENLINEDVVTKEEIVDWFREELDKLA